MNLAVVITVALLVVIASSFLVAGGHRTTTTHVTVPAIDPTLITLRVGHLPVEQVDELF